MATVTFYDAQVDAAAIDAAKREARLPRVAVVPVQGLNTYQPNCETTDVVFINQPNADFTILSPVGVPVDGQKLLIRIASGSTGYAPTWGGNYLSAGLTLPTAALPANKTVTIGVIYDARPQSWVLLALDMTGY